MIKQRNANLTKQNKLDYNKLKQQSPFNRQNPYKVKAQFYSQKKRSSTTTTIDRNSNNNRKVSRQSNPQSLKYRRDYKQNPPTMLQYRQLKDNFIQVKNNILTRNLSRSVEQQLSLQQYRLKLKQFVADKFCPSDPYLQIVKDKYVYFSNHNSQFHNTMKMSNLGISNLTTNSRYTPQSTLSYKDRLNPFYRKNLLSSQNDTQLLLKYGTTYNNTKWQYFPQIMQSSRVTSYQYSNPLIGPSSSHYQQVNCNGYQISIPPPSDPKHQKQHKSSSYSQQSASRISNGTHNYNRQYSDNLITSRQNPSPKSSLAASFGPDYQWKVNEMIRPYVDAVIEHHLEGPLNIQSKAPQQIKIKGKIFHLNHLNRL